MATLMSKNQLNYARKKFYGEFYITRTELKFIDKLINKILINIYLFKYTLVNIKRKTLRIFYVLLNKKSDQNVQILCGENVCKCPYWKQGLGRWLWF